MCLRVGERGREREREDERGESGREREREGDREREGEMAIFLCL